MADNLLIAIPDPGNRGVGRYSTRPLPAYRFVPGVHPHPVRDPAGHSYEPVRRPSRHAPWRIEEWRQLAEWLYGVDLFNGFFFWEAHEAWEGLWATAERTAAPGLLLQGLIQIAAALLKVHMGVLPGARVLSHEGIDKLRRAAITHPMLLGLDVPAVTASYAAYFAPVEQGALPEIGPRVPLLRLAI